MRPAHEHFLSVCDQLDAMLARDERYLVSFQGEDSDFVRLNHARIRQAGRVHQRSITLDLIADGRHASATSPLSDAEDSGALLSALLTTLRDARTVVDIDPHLSYSESPVGSVREDEDFLPDSRIAVHAMCDGGAGMDLVGLWAAGGIQRGFASSFGQRSWHSVHTFNASWSCHLQADRSVSGSYAGTRFEQSVLARRLQHARREIEALEKPVAHLSPGRFRAYFAPAAVQELLGMLCWGGFSQKAHRTSTSSLLRLAAGEVHLDSGVTIGEDRMAGLAPCFTSTGFATPASVPLITAGRLHGLLTSPRSAREFGLAPNADSESPESLVMASGSIPESDMLARLGTGLWISNLWYCNFSDPNACRITGMTRFACWYVEDAQIRAPLPVMRFDDSIYGLLGERLLGITSEREHLLSTSSYGSRSFESMLVPGILVDDLNLTL